MKATQELIILREAANEIADIAQGFGLDFGEVCFEVCPADVIYTVGAYGMPTRFSHWSFGKAFHKMKLMYDLNVSRIYELVINSSPAYAFLLEGNSVLQNKLVIAHVFAHCDFFKNNVRFKDTGKYMMNLMTVHANRIKEYESKYGTQKVEEILDAILAINEHIDPYPKKEVKEEDKAAIPTTSYDDIWSIGEKKSQKEAEEKVKKFPATPQKDILRFILKHSRVLNEWEKDIISMLHEEMFYFWPQLETKIMNEGWASYWHLRIMRELSLSEDETIEFAKTNAYILHPSETQLNPYHIGLKIWESIYKRWENPSQEDKEKFALKGGEGTQKIFEVRETETDISFIRNYLTKELVEELDLYVFQKIGQEWKITEKNWKNVREELVAKLVNGGFPYIVVENGDFQENGHLYLRHCHEEVDLDIRYLEKTLPHMFRLWGKTVHLETMLEGKPVLFSYDGEKNYRKGL